MNCDVKIKVYAVENMWIIITVWQTLFKAQGLSVGDLLYETCDLCMWDITTVYQPFYDRRAPRKAKRKKLQLN